MFKEKSITSSDDDKMEMKKMQGSGERSTQGQVFWELRMGTQRGQIGEEAGGGRGWLCYECRECVKAEDLVISLICASRNPSADKLVEWNKVEVDVLLSAMNRIDTGPDYYKKI